MFKADGSLGGDELALRSHECEAMLKTLRSQFR